MSFGIPCDTTPPPQQVFQSITDLDTMLASILQSITETLQSYLTEMDYAINAAFTTLQRSINVRLGTIDSKINSLVSTIQSELTSLASVTNTDLSSFVYQVSTLTQQPQEEVITQPLEQLFPTTAQPGLPGTTQQPPVAGPSAPFPLYGPPGSPFVPQQPQQPPYVPTTPFPPQTAPVAPPATPPPSIPPPVVSLVINGATVQASQVCPPQTSGPPILVGGQTWQPVVSVWSTATPLPVDDSGTPQLPVSVDVQPDGSAVVSIGPISVVMALPSANPANQGAQCPLDFNPVNPITGL